MKDSALAVDMTSDEKEYGPAGNETSRQKE